MAEKHELGELLADIRSGSERVVYINSDQHTDLYINSGQHIDLSKIDYTRGKEDGISTGIAYAMGLMCRLSGEASVKCLAPSADRNVVLQELIKEIYTQNLLHCDYRHLEILTERLMKGIYKPMESEL